MEVKPSNTQHQSSSHILASPQTLPPTQTFTSPPQALTSPHQIMACSQTLDSPITPSQTLNSAQAIASPETPQALNSSKNLATPVQLFVHPPSQHSQLQQPSLTSRPLNLASQPLIPPPINLSSPNDPSPPLWNANGRLKYQL